MFCASQIAFEFRLSFAKDRIIITDSLKPKGYAFRYVVYVFLRITVARSGVAKTVGRISKYVNSNLTFNYFMF